MSAFLHEFSRQRLACAIRSSCSGHAWKWALYSFSSMTLWGLFGAGAMPSFAAQPVPVDKQAYVGRWAGSGVELEMTSEGQVKYVTRQGPTSKSLLAQLRRFEGDDFEAGVWVLAQDFEVSEPPAYRNGRWTMTVNGVQLQRTHDRASR